jgi:hypothetical protein
MMKDSFEDSERKWRSGEKSSCYPGVVCLSLERNGVIDSFVLLSLTLTHSRTIYKSKPQGCVKSFHVVPTLHIHNIREEVPMRESNQERELRESSAPKSDWTNLE